VSNSGTIAKRTLGPPEADIVALQLIATSNGPVGSSRLLKVLEDAGFSVAEATVGRYLRELDNRNLTEPRGRLGRVITSHGLDYLKNLVDLQRLDEQSAQIMEASSPHDLAELIDLLYVRRAIEPEAARLAALRATQEEITHLSSIVELHHELAPTGNDRVAPALDFHRQLLEASHNALLIAVGRVALEPAKDTNEQLLDRVALDAEVAGISKEQAHEAAIAFACEHHEILDAIKARQSHRAEEIMRSHIDKLIRSVEQYRARTESTDHLERELSTKGE